MVSIKKNVVIGLLALFLIESKTECLFSGFWNQLSAITGYKFKKEQENTSATRIENVATNILNVDTITYDELGEYVPQTLFDLFIELFQAQVKNKKSFAAACRVQNNNFKPLNKEDQKNFIKTYCADCHQNCQLKGKEKADCFRNIGEKLMRSYQSCYVKTKSPKDLDNILDTIQAEVE